MLKIDLGCGPSTQDGFTGVDRFPFGNVDVVADLDESLPFDSDSVDLLYASHSLEHVRDLMATMREVYRVCKHGAQICIVAPYNEQKLNLANPYHICVFNEHTPRFWTDCPDAFVDPEEYAHPHAPHWGLSHSDHSDPGLDLRLVRMEFFYFPEYRNFSIDELRVLRRERLDVCDQIMYHLIVWKGDEHSPGRTFADHVAAFELFEPNYVKQRKTIERDELLKVTAKERDAARSQIVELQSALAQKDHLLTDVSYTSRRVSELETDLDRAEKNVADMRSENYQMRMQLAGAFEKVEVLCDQLQATKVFVSKSQTEAVALTEKITNRRVSELETDLDRAERHLADMRSENYQMRMQLAGAFEKAEVLSDQLQATKVFISKSQTEAVVLTETISRLRQENVVSNEQAITLAENLQSVQGELVKVNTDGVNTINSLHSIMMENYDLRTRLENVELVKARMSLVKAELEASNGLLAWYQSQDASRSTETSRMREELAGAHLFRNHLEEGKKIVGGLYAQLTAYRSSRMVRLASLFKRNDALWESVSPEFYGLKSYTAQHFQKTSRANLVLGDDLSALPYREYVIPFGMGSLSKVSLAIRPLLSTSQGTVGVEIVSSTQRVLVQVSLPLSDINPAVPTDFIVPTPLVDLGEAWSLRVFVRSVDVPVAIYELVNYPAFSRRIDYIPFVFLQ